MSKSLNFDQSLSVDKEVKQQNNYATKEDNKLDNNPVIMQNKGNMHQY